MLSDCEDDLPEDGSGEVFPDCEDDLLIIVSSSIAKIMYPHYRINYGILQDPY